MSPPPCLLQCRQPRRPTCLSHSSHTTHNAHAPHAHKSLVRVVSKETNIPEDECFALMALAELPEQYAEVRRLGILKA